MKIKTKAEFNKAVKKAEAIWNRHVATCKKEGRVEGVMDLNEDQAELIDALMIADKKFGTDKRSK